MAKPAAAMNPLFPLFVLLIVQLVSATVDAALLDRKAAVGGREGSESDNSRYVVIFDAGGISTDVHVFRFDESANLLEINGELDVHHAVSEPLSSYADNPAGIANFMVLLMEKALDAVPADRQSETPVLFGAFDQLFLIGEEKYEEMLQVIREVFEKSPLVYKPEWVTILPPAKQGAYIWDTVNYLLGNIGGDYSKTVAILNQESASTLVTYAISSKAAANAPYFPNGQEYITAHRIQSKRYYLYSHGYFPYGAYGVRTRILKYTNDSYTYCVTPAYDEQWEYYGEIFNVRAAPTGSDYEKCRENILLALNLNATCYVKNCTFDGAWSGGGGPGIEKFYLTQGFHNTGADVGIANRSNPSTNIKLSDYEEATKTACGVKSFEEAHKLYPDVPLFDLPYLCMDLVYVYAVLVDGFRIDPTRVVTAANAVPYGGSSVSVQWCLGAALELLSYHCTNMPTVTSLVQVV